MPAPAPRQIAPTLEDILAACRVIARGQATGVEIIDALYAGARSLTAVAAGFDRARPSKRVANMRSMIDANAEFGPLLSDYMHGRARGSAFCAEFARLNGARTLAQRIGESAA